MTNNNQNAFNTLNLLAGQAALKGDIDEFKLWFKNGIRFGVKYSTHDYHFLTLAINMCRFNIVKYILEECKEKNLSRFLHLWGKRKSTIPQYILDRCMESATINSEDSILAGMKKMYGDEDGQKKFNTWKINRDAIVSELGKWKGV